MDVNRCPRAVKSTKRLTRGKEEDPVIMASDESCWFRIFPAHLEMHRALRRLLVPSAAGEVI